MTDVWSPVDDERSLLWDLLEPPAWHKNAACKGMGAPMFFPTRGEEQHHAVAVCNGCPVIVECAEAGTREVWGIWGGRSGKARRLQRRAA